MARVMVMVVLVLGGCRSLVPVIESSCSDGVQNGEETGTDCGGPVCGACSVTAPTCSDGVLNQRESDVDCGGECSDCLPGQRCTLAEDCASLVCTNGRCVAPAPCMNQLQDGTETDVDCGGPSCARCIDGKRCTAFADCLALTCVISVCGRAATCTDGEQNGDESSIDCGGGSCPSCADGSSCRANADCTSGNCGGSFTCRPTPGSCTDQTLNGSESDVDCGGPSCPRCVVGGLCQQPSDCFTASCTQGRCAAIPTCADGARNGDESDVDCGGSLCARCPAGDSCGGPADCFTGLCSANVCSAPAGCSDQVRNGNESDVDCGGPVCSPCAVTQRCNVNSDCASTSCNDQFLRTDTTWRVSASQSPGWNTVAFNDSAWSMATSEGAHGTGPPWGASPPMPPSTQAHWIWNRDSRVSGDFSTLYFRKTFVAPASPFVLHAAADDTFTAYLDGVAVSSGVIWFTPGVVTLTPTPGVTSVLAFSVTNGGGAGGLVADARVTQARCAP